MEKLRCQFTKVVQELGHLAGGAFENFSEVELLSLYPPASAITRSHHDDATRRAGRWTILLSLAVTRFNAVPEPGAPGRGRAASRLTFVVRPSPTESGVRRRVEARAHLSEVGSPH